MKPGTSFATLVFALVALAHVLRLALGVPVTIGSWNVPMWVSVAGGLVTAVLALVLWRENRVAGTPRQR